MSRLIVGSILKLKHEWAEFDADDEFAVEEVRYGMTGILNKFIDYVKGSIFSMFNSSIDIPLQLRVRCVQGSLSNKNATVSITYEEDVEEFISACTLVGVDESMEKYDTWVYILVIFILIAIIAYPIITYWMDKNKLKVSEIQGSLNSQFARKPPNFYAHRNRDRNRYRDT